MTHNSHETKAIRQRMEEVRCDLDKDVQGIVEGARDLRDWRSYVVFFNGAARLNPPQLFDGVTRVLLVCRLLNYLQVPRIDEPEFNELFVPQKPQGDKVSTPFFECGIVLLNYVGRIDVQAGGDLARCVADHFVHVDFQYQCLAFPFHAFELGFVCLHPNGSHFDYSGLCAWLKSPPPSWIIRRSSRDVTDVTVGITESNRMIVPVRWMQP